MVLVTISTYSYLRIMSEEKKLKEYLSEGVKLGHFDPEVLNVDINDIRKGNCKY